MKFSFNTTTLNKSIIENEKERFLSCLNKVMCRYSYVRIPKTGSASLNRSLYNATNEAFAFRASSPERKNMLLQSPPDWWCHYSASWQKEIVGAQTWDKIFSFSVVRNPFERLYSLWKFSKISEDHNLTFEEWVLSGCKSPWLGIANETFPKEMVTSQKAWVIEDEKIIVSCIFRLEELTTIGADILSSLLGGDRFYIHDHRMNQVAKEGEYKKHYTPELIDHVSQLCAEDLQMFKYNFEGVTEPGWFYMREL